MQKTMEGSMDMNDDIGGFGSGNNDGKYSSYWSVTQEPQQKIRKFKKSICLMPMRKTAYGVPMKLGDRYYKELGTGKWYSVTELAAEQLEGNGKFEYV